MTERSDLLGRLTDLDAGTETHRATARAIQKMINHGDYAGATTALDDLETALHPALAGGNGGGTPAIVGAAVEATFVSSYDGSRVLFDAIHYDPGGWWDADNRRLTTPADFTAFGLFLISAQVRLDATSPIPDVPEFEIGLSSTLWNYDPVLFEIPPAHDADAYIGQIAIPLPLGPECNVYLDGWWGGFTESPSADLHAILSVFQLGILA